MDDISFDMNFDSETASRIREIAAAKERAVQAEDYDTAKRLKVRTYSPESSPPSRAREAFEAIAMLIFRVNESVF